MQLQMCRHVWGIESPLAACLTRFQRKGYTAIEMPIAMLDAAANDLLAANGFGYVAMIFTEGSTVAEHVAAFRRDAGAAAAAGAMKIVAHGGRDHWPAAERTAFYRECVAIEADLPIAVAHETHRGRCFFSPWATRDVLNEFPALKICCDFSHWVCVAERLAWDDPAGSIAALCAKRTIHLHARVGYENGPQVPDPSAAEWRHHVGAHLKWWKMVWTAQRARGDKVSTATPEFGPPGYMHTLPHTNVPVANLETVCDWMTDYVRKEFQSNVV